MRDVISNINNDGLLGKLDCGFKQQIDPKTCCRSKIMQVKPGCPEEKKK